MKLVHRETILGEDSERMSKSRGNVVNPGDIVREYGAHAVRLYEMLMGRLERDGKPSAVRGGGETCKPRPRTRAWG